MGVGPLNVSFPRVFRMVFSKESSVSECYKARVNTVHWIVSFRRPLHQFEETQYRESLSLISNIFICRDSKDAQIWKPLPSGSFLATAFYLALVAPPQPITTSDLVWLGLTPPRVEAFWQYAVEKVSTSDNQWRRGLTLDSIFDICVMCRKDQEFVYHFFLHCKVTYKCGIAFLSKCNMTWCFPSVTSELVHYWG